MEQSGGIPVISIDIRRYIPPKHGRYHSLVLRAHLQRASSASKDYLLSARRALSELTRDLWFVRHILRLSADLTASLMRVVSTVNL